MKRILARIILITDVNSPMWERLKYMALTVAQFAPIAFVLDLINWWIKDNQQFGTFMCLSLLINALVGVWYHLARKTFNFKDFWMKNFEMVVVVIVVYIMLEMLRYTAGDNLAGELFKILIQVTTLLYPTSKVLKNIFILTKGNYPPKYLMRRLYSFEKNGDLGDLFKTKKNEIDDHYNAG